MANSNIKRKSLVYVKDCQKKKNNRISFFLADKMKNNIPKQHKFEINVNKLKSSIRVAAYIILFPFHTEQAIKLQ